MIQRIAQALFLLIFILLLFFSSVLVTHNIPADVFLRMSPFIAISVMIASRTIVAGMSVSLIIMGTALIFGRFFCAYVCPFGTTIDFFDWLFLRKSKRRGVKNPEKLRNLKYYILGFLAVSSLFSLTLIHAFDPIALATRIYTFLFYPLSVYIVNFSIDIFRPLAARFNWVGLSLTRFFQPVFLANFTTVLLFALILALNIIQPRFWCRKPLPAGCAIKPGISFWIPEAHCRSRLQLLSSMPEAMPCGSN